MTGLSYVVFPCRLYRDIQPLVIRSSAQSSKTARVALLVNCSSRSKGIFFIRLQAGQMKRVSCQRMNVMTSVLRRIQNGQCDWLEADELLGPTGDDESIGCDRSRGCARGAWRARNSLHRTRYSCRTPIPPARLEALSNVRWTRVTCALKAARNRRRTWLSDDPFWLLS